MSTRSERRRKYKRYSRVEKVWNWVRKTFGKFAYPYKLLLKWERAKAYEMGRKQELNLFFTDIICSAGESAVYTGRFTRQEIQSMYLKFGKQLGLTDLLPRKLANTRIDQRALKGAIMRRIGPEAKARFKAEQKEKWKGHTRKAIKSRLTRMIRRINATDLKTAA